MFVKDKQKRLDKSDKSFDFTDPFKVRAINNRTESSVRLPLSNVALVHSNTLFASAHVHDECGASLQFFLCSAYSIAT